MSDCAVLCILAFLGGGGVGGFIVNEIAWRKSQRESEQMRRDLDANSAKWDAEMATLKAGCCIYTGIIPGRPGQEVDSGGDSFIPPLRPDSPRAEDRAYARPTPNPRLEDRG